ncbi:hypothetical protein ANME2D_01821 [Candidatus Methanoperedens nitroreducens]|uniref:Uncharacterized protein n=1 Tax=Candidatus Methanoperedens nitratireducens TaxID=1392998 RepID=A0A062UXR0_9EURY|nr:hypothetical protein [Candidatus Methanoperedens nitroreducens]KCZ71766.1 hypothetical protein ANME2D_01821 [Candidatus Methanoperedens nitroreducens]MDJ1422261.1 hypothetical protein [Candidatus Methanoperedens sp.]
MGIIENRDAQFMLLAGFIIAIGLVITTVLLNSVIFEGNMAIGAGTEPSKIGIINLMEITRDETRSAYRNATAPGTDYTLRFTNFSNQMQNFSTNLSKIYALHGEGINVSWDVSNWENSLFANFTENGTASGAVDWTVVEGVRNTTAFELRRINVSAGGYFIINVTNSSASVWSMNFTGGNQINVTNKTGGISNYTDDYNYINILDSTYEFNSSTLNEIYNINFVRGNEAWGQFTIKGNHTIYNKKFIRSRDYILNATAVLYTSRMRANITIPVSVPW